MMVDLENGDGFVSSSRGVSTVATGAKGGRSGSCELWRPERSGPSMASGLRRLLSARP